MLYKVKTFLENKEVASENITITNKVIYGVVNKYIKKEKGIKENA